MPDFNVIANTSDTLVAVLTEALRDVDPIGIGTTAPTAVLHDLHRSPAPQEQQSGVLAITLVEAREDPSNRNRPRVRQPDQVNNGRVSISKPPMALSLRYVLTPWSKDITSTDAHEERQLEHRMLGRVAQVLYEGAIISGTTLQGQGNPPDGDGLAGSNEALKVSLAQLTFEEQTRFWHAVQQKYRASLTYDVRVVNLQSTRATSSARVASRELHYGLVEK